MDPSEIVHTIVSLAAAFGSSSVIWWRIAVLERKVEAMALERVENDVRVTKLEERVGKIEQGLVA